METTETTSVLASDESDVAARWLKGLAARGIHFRLVNGRLRGYPKRAERELTDEEVLIRRHYRAAIVAALRDGWPSSVEPEPTTQVIPPASSSEPEPKVAPPCSYCYSTPCIGVEHPAYFDLHPIDAQRRADRLATQVMLSRVGARSPIDF